MTRALVTQMLNALEHHQSQTRPIHKTEFAITAAREYLETALKPTLKEALTQQGIKLRTEFEPKQRDHIEDSLGMVGDRAELVAMLRSACIDGTLHAKLVNKAADMLEADAQQAKRVPMTPEHLCALADRLTPNTETGSLDYLRYARAIEAHHGITPADKPTGWDNGLSQDYCAEFGKWLASRPGARQQIKAMFDEPEEEDLYALALKADNWGQP